MLGGRRLELVSQACFRQDVTESLLVVGSLGSNSDRPKVTFIGSRANFSGCGRDVWMRATSVLRGRHRGDNEGRRQLSQICMEQRGKWLEAFKQTNVDVVDEKLGNGFKVKGVCIDTDGTLLVLVHNVSLLAMAKALDDVDFHNYWS